MNGHLLSNQLRVVGCPNPFTTERVDLALGEGMTIAQMIDLVQPDPMIRQHANVYVGDCFVAPEWYAHVRPKAGQIVAIRVGLGNPGGGGGGGGKNPLRTVLTIAVMAASMAFGAALGAMILGQELAATSLFTLGSLNVTVGGLVGGGIISAVGNLMVNAIAPPPKASTSSSIDFGSYGGDTSRASQALSISGSSNIADSYGVVPCILGQRRYYPKKAARDYTEIVGSDQYLRCLFDFGYGPLQLSDKRIGAIPLEQYEGVEFEYREGWPDDPPITLYSNTIREDGYNLKVTSAGGRQIVETRDGADEGLLDVGFAGLVHFDDSGNRQSHSVTMRIEYRKVGDADWTLHSEGAVTAATESAVRNGWRIVFPSPARYQVGVTRLTADNTSTRYRDDSFVTALRTVQYSYPVKAKGRAALALRIKATNQLTGVIDQFSAVAQRIYRVWTGMEFVWQASRHPAWAYLYIATGGAGNKRGKPDSQMDLTGLKAWADETPDRTYDSILDYDSTVFEVLRNIAAGGRASYGKPNGKYGVVRDVAQTTPVQVFSPRNSWGFKAHRIFKEDIHGFRCRYVEPERDWSEQVVVAYADGYDETNATKLEDLRFPDTTNRTQAWKDGRYHYAVGELRPELYEFWADIENLVCERGDLIRMGHDVPMWGGGTGRVKALIKNEANQVSGVVLDELMIMESGKLYSLVIRTPNQPGGWQHSLVTEPGETTTFHFLLPAPDVPGAVPEVGDLATFGEAERETAPLIVKAIDPSTSTLKARVICLDAAIAIHDADQGPLPAWDPIISEPALFNPAPTPPAIDSVVTNEDALIRSAGGSLICRILINLIPRSSSVALDRLEIVSRPSGSGEAWSSWPSAAPFTTQLVLSPVEDGRSYDIKLRYVSLGGIPSDWTLIWDCRVVGTSTKPPAPSELLVEKLPGGTLRYRVTGEQPIDSAGYRFRWNMGVNDAWAPATPAHAGLITGGFFEAAAFAARTFTMLAKQVDSSGNESEGVAFAVVQLGDLVTDRLVDSHDFAALNWPGAIVGGTVNGGTIMADPAEVMFTDPNMPMFTDPNTPLIASFEALSYQTSFIPLRTGNFSLDWMVAGSGAQIFYRRPGNGILFTDPNTPLFTDSATPVFDPSSWLPWIGPFQVAAGELVEVKAAIPGGSTGGAIENLTALIDVPVETEHLEDITIPPEGMRLPLSRSYEEIVKVGSQVQTAPGATAIRVQVIDKSTAGPLVQGFDADNNPATAYSDFDIQGVLAS